MTGTVKKRSFFIGWKKICRALLQPLEISVKAETIQDYTMFELVILPWYNAI